MKAIKDWPKLALAIIGCELVGVVSGLENQTGWLLLQF